MKKTKLYISSFIIFTILVAVDQITKFLAYTKLQAGYPVDIIKNVLQFSYIRNSGAAWGIFSGKQGFFVVTTCLMLAVIILIFIRTPKQRRYYPLLLTMICLSAGATGNFIDRLINGYVHDFIYFEIIDFPIFNFADICVTVSMAMLIILIIFKYKDDDFEYLSFHRHHNESESINEKK